MLKFLERFSFYKAEHEFLYGIAAVLLLILLIKILLWLLKSKKCPGIHIPGERGDLFITSGAIEDFVIRCLADRDEMVIDKVKLSQKKSGFSIVIYMRVASETVITELRPLIEHRVLEHSENRMGIDNLNSVNIILKNFSAKERQIKSRHKLAMKEYTAIEEEELEDLKESPKVD